MKRYSIWMDDDTTAKLIRQILGRYIGATDVRASRKPCSAAST
jgi:hypothetical protein